jgi:hypothetical protein
VKEMATEDLKAAERDALVTQHGYAALTTSTNLDRTQVP